MSVAALCSVVGNLTSTVNQFSQDIEEIKSKLVDLRPAVSYDDTLLRAHLERSLKQADDSIKRDRTLLETTLAHKLEQHLTRMVKERVDMLRDEFNTKLAAIVVQPEPVPVPMPVPVPVPVPAPVPEPAPLPTPAIPVPTEPVPTSPTLPDPTPAEVEAVLTEIDLGGEAITSNDYDIDIKTSALKKSKTQVSNSSGKRK